MSDLSLERWPDPPAADWTAEANIPIDFKDPSKTIPASWASDMLCRWALRNPANFGNEMGITAKRWALAKLGKPGE